MTKIRKLNAAAAAIIVEIADILRHLPMADRDRFAGLMVELVWKIARHDRRAERWHDYFERLECLREEAQQHRDYLDRKRRDEK